MLCRVEREGVLIHVARLTGTASTSFASGSTVQGLIGERSRRISNDDMLSNPHEAYQRKKIVKIFLFHALWATSLI